MASASSPTARRARPHRRRQDWGAAALFALVAIAWTFPLILHLGTHIPGSGPGDNVTGLWNLWWMRTALSSHEDFFRTALLFAPTGVDLTLNTHMALPALVGATVLEPLSIVAALNVTILAALFLNGWCAYCLASRVTEDAGAAMVAGLIFGGSTYVTAHLNGHFSLVDAWVLPLFAGAMWDALHGSVRWAIAAGLVLGGAVFVDYYYVVFAGVLGLCLLAGLAFDWSIERGQAGPARRWGSVVGWLILADVVLMVVIVAGHDLTLAIGSRRLLLLGLYNPLQVFWALVALGLMLRLNPRVRARPRSSWGARSARSAAVVAAVALAVASPLVWKGARLILRGDYVSQRYWWRSAPPGVDLATLLVGNPFHAVWGPAVQHLYGRWGMNLIESGGGWLGLVPLLLVVWTVRREWHRESVRLWAAVGAIFVVWAFGPHLMAFGRATGMILPETVLRWIPVASNARMPGRAIVVADLAVAVLGALGLAAWRARSTRPTLVLVGVALLTTLDLLPAPFPLVALDHPSLYDVLRDRPESGAVCELPLGLRDGFGEIGHLDDRVLFYQTIHRRPIVGGFVARLPPSVVDAYRTDPLISALLRLSTPAVDQGETPPSRDAAARLLRRDGIRFVVLNRRAASAALIDYVVTTLPLTLVEDEDGRSLFVTNDR